MADTKENIGSDLRDYQKWVDFDMVHYGKISDETNDMIKKAGLQLVKDEYGDYEVIAGDEHVDESCGSVKESINVMEALTEDDMKALSELTLTDEELSHLVSLFELITDDNKDAALKLIIGIFKGKKLVPDNEEVEEAVTNTRTTISERYTRILLGDK